MSSYRSKLIVAVMLGAGAATAGTVLADGYAGRGGCGHQLHAGIPHAFGYSEERIERMAKRLDLTDQQLASLRAIVDKNRPQLRKVLDRMAAGRKQIRAFMTEGNVDDARLSAAADNQGKALSEMIVLRMKMKTDIDKLLTDEQRKKLHRMKRHVGHPFMGRERGGHAS